MQFYRVFCFVWCTSALLLQYSVALVNSYHSVTLSLQPQIWLILCYRWVIGSVLLMISVQLSL